MRIIVISDTHRNYAALESIVQRNLGADLFLHLGDGEYELDLVLSRFPELQARTWHIRGNCDYGSCSPPILTLGLEYGHSLLAVHGHTQQVKSSLEHLKALARVNQADIALFGHTHQRYQCYEDGLYLLNPGSAGCPRDGKPPSYGIVEVSKAGILTNIVPVSL